MRRCCGLWRAALGPPPRGVEAPDRPPGFEAATPELADEVRGCEAATPELADEVRGCEAATPSWLMRCAGVGRSRWARGR